MKRTTIILLVTLILGQATSAQTRKRSTTSRSKASAAAAAAEKAEAVRMGGKTVVADQIKYLTKFIYLLGGAASNIAAVDESVKRKQSTPEIAQQNQQAKLRIKGNISQFREALDKLEINFRTTPELEPYYIKLAGVAAGAANAEQQAGNEQFDAAGRTLLAVVNRLTDVLLVMR